MYLAIQSSHLVNLGKKKTNEIQLWWCTLEELKNFAEFLLLLFDREWCTVVDDLRVSTEDCCDTVVATIGVLFCFSFILLFVCLFVSVGDLSESTVQWEWELEIKTHIVGGKIKRFVYGSFFCVGSLQLWSQQR
jgi:hypothetical protein